MTKHKTSKKRLGFIRNIKPVFLLLLIPIGIGVFVTVAVVTGLYRNNLADVGNRRLATPGWEQAKAALTKAQPDYVRKYAYYKVKDGQSLSGLASFFGVDPKELAAMNPGAVVAGTTIKLPPIEKPYVPVASNGLIKLATVTEDRGIIRVSKKFRDRQPIVTNIPELMALLAPYKVIDQTGPTTFRVNKPFSVEGDIRLDITAPTVTKIELVSTPDDISCLCFDEAAVLIKGVDVTSVVPSTGRPDTSFADGRSFVRMKNGRLDILDSHFSYLGNALDDVTQSEAAKLKPYLREGGVYGVSWRISNGTLGSNTVTGWIERSSFQHNHFGTYSFGASGMTWKDSYFAHNDIYGLDPHDDSNNALIQGNVFEANGKHGFIVSKRCNYNIIRNNISLNNKLHGYMLHLNSAYNLVENNIAYGNEDSFVVYESNYNTIRNNVSYAPRSAGVRINRPANNSYVTGNTLLGGKRGVYLYEGVRNVLVDNNNIHGVQKTLQTDGAGNVAFSDNTVDGLFYDIASGDTSGMVYGLNTVQNKKMQLPSADSVLRQFRSTHPDVPSR